MVQKTLRDLNRRVDLLEQQVLRLRQRLGASLVPEVSTSHPVDLDATLDRFFEAVGIKGEQSGLAHLRALQAEQEKWWSQQNGKSLAEPSPRSKRKARPG